MIHLEQGQLIPQAHFALAERIDPATNRRYALTNIEVKPFDKRGRLLLDSRVVDVPMAYKSTFVMPSSLKSLFFSSLKNES